MRHHAKFHQNRWHGCRDMAILRFSIWRPSAILDLWRSNFLTVGEVKRPILHQHTKFHKDRSNRCRDIAIFVIFQDGGRRHLGFSKIKNFNGRSTARSQYVSSCHISSKSAEQSQRYGDLSFFQNGGRPPSWICWVPIGTIHDDHLTVSIVMPNLFKIDEVISITWNFQYFARLAWKRLFTPQKLGFGVFHLQNEEQYQRNPPKAHPCASPRRLSRQAWKSVDRVWPVGDFVKKGINK